MIFTYEVDIFPQVKGIGSLLWARARDYNFPLNKKLKGKKKPAPITTKVGTGQALNIYDKIAGYS